MAEGLPVSRVVNVDVSFAPVAAPGLQFDTLLILGDSTVIDTGEGLREYQTFDEVSKDFGPTAPEYQAANLYFAQTPQPHSCYIGRWAATATAGVLVGGPLNSFQQQLSVWHAVTNGGFGISVDGGLVTNVIGLSFVLASSLNAVASTITLALAGKAVCIWDAVRSQFRFTSATTGATSSVSFTTPPTGGATDAGLLLLTTAPLAERSSQGMAIETPVAAVTRLDGLGWYALMFASTAPITDISHGAVSNYIEATDEKHLYGITTSEATVLDPSQTTDIASQSAAMDYTRTMVQYSIYSPYAVASIFGRAFSTNFEGNNTTITLKFKREPGVTPELLTTTQANTLAAKRCNVYIQYNNGTSIFQEGVMSGAAYFDEIHGLDWLANRIQNDLWNLLYSAPKIPQTDNGIHQLTTRCVSSLNQGVNNGLIAPGVWNAPGFGILYDGAFLSTGYYIYSDSVDNQDQSIREQRIAPLIQCAVKLAGAVHFASVLINVNR